MSLLEDDSIEFEKLEYVAIGISNEIEGGEKLKKREGILSGRIRRIFGIGNK